MRITVKAVGEVVSKQGPKKAYNVFELIYESDGRVGTRNIMEFAGDVFKTLSGAKPGQVYDVDAVKGEKYWDWKSVTLVTGAAAKVSEQETASSAGKGGRSGGSWETPEERAAKQVYIVRQSSLGHALTFLTQQESPCTDVQKVLNVAKQFEAYVFSTLSSNDLDLEEDRDDIE